LIWVGGGFEGFVEEGEGFDGVVLELEDVVPAVAVGGEVFDQLSPRVSAG